MKGSQLLCRKCNDIYFWRYNCLLTVCFNAQKYRIFIDWNTTCYLESSFMLYKPPPNSSNIFWQKLSLSNEKGNEMSSNIIVLANLKVNFYTWNLQKNMKTNNLINTIHTYKDYWAYVNFNRFYSSKQKHPNPWFKHF